MANSKKQREGILNLKFKILKGRQELEDRGEKITDIKFQKTN